MEKQLQFRQAERQDVPLILRFIRDLAAYEKMEDQVVADEATLAEWLFERRSAEVCFAMLEGKEVGFALYFHNFSTFLGRAGLYLEDLYVLPQYRGQGIGKAILRHLARLAVDRGWVGWSGGVWTGTAPASPFTAPWAPSLWTSGQCTA